MGLNLYYKYVICDIHVNKLEITHQGSDGSAGIRNDF